MMTCPSCGEEIREAKFCPRCGKPTGWLPPEEETESGQPEEEIREEPREKRSEASPLPHEKKKSARPSGGVKYIYYSRDTDLIIPARFRPLTGWGYFGYGVLFLVPVVGWIAALVFSFNRNNLARRNFARGFLLLLFLFVLIGLVLYLLFPRECESIWDSLGLLFPVII